MAEGERRKAERTIDSIADRLTAKRARESLEPQIENEMRFRVAHSQLKTRNLAIVSACLHSSISFRLFCVLYISVRLCGARAAPTARARRTRDKTTATRASETETAKWIEWKNIISSICKCICSRSCRSIVSGPRPRPIARNY